MPAVAPTKRDQTRASSEHPLMLCCDWFAPGVKAGGPIQSCVNLVKLLSKHREIRIITSDRDLGDSVGYPDIIPDEWRHWNHAMIYYGSRGFSRIRAFYSECRNNSTGTVYINSMFSFASAIAPLILCWSRFRHISVILAPRGMLKPSALSQKAWKKKPMLRVLKLLGVMRKVQFHATSEDEVSEIKSTFGEVEITLLANVPVRPVDNLPIPTDEAIDNTRLVFVGRVHPVKNLLWILEALSSATVPIEFAIVGPTEDQGYMQKCTESVNKLPRHVKVRFTGPCGAEEVRQHLKAADLLVLPTLGENFGHAIFESLAVGTPVVISDQTIWRRLRESRAGWDLPLDRPDSFIGAIEEYAGFTLEERTLWKRGALDLASKFFKENVDAKSYLRLFDSRSN